MNYFFCNFREFVRQRTREVRESICRPRQSDLHAQSSASVSKHMINCLPPTLHFSRPSHTIPLCGLECTCLGAFSFTEGIILWPITSTLEKMSIFFPWLKFSICLSTGGTRTPNNVPAVIIQFAKRMVRYFISMYVYTVYSH